MSIDVVRTAAIALLDSKGAEKVSSALKKAQRATNRPRETRAA
ncbi:MAG TPA: hypothetical protein VG105_04015 [Paraburkholderia sp.]|jgi:hypothetical protein|nr:hypothetical protein [Paraburkholderia sp.]